MQRYGKTNEKNYVPTAFGGSPTIPRFDDFSSAMQFLESISSPDNPKVSLESCQSSSSSPICGTVVYGRGSYTTNKIEECGSFRSRGSASPY